jgi:hypothetical protein
MISRMIAHKMEFARFAETTIESCRFIEAFAS